MAVALLVAAGSGERLGAGRPKAFVVLAGRPMLEWSVEALVAAGIEEIVVALPPGGAPPPGCVGVAGGGPRPGSGRRAAAGAGGCAARPRTRGGWRRWGRTCASSCPPGRARSSPLTPSARRWPR